MATIPNPPTNWDELDDRTLALKCGRTIYDAELLTVLKEIAAALGGGARPTRRTKDA